MADEITRAAELADAERWARDAMNGTVPSHLATLLAEYDRRGVALEHAEHMGIGEFRVTQWAYEQAVRVMNERGAELDRVRARVAELETAGTSHTEWSVRASHGKVWQLSPPSQGHARSMLASEGGTLVNRQVWTVPGPWVEVSS